MKPWEGWKTNLERYNPPKDIHTKYFFKKKVLFAVCKYFGINIAMIVLLHSV